MRDRAAPDGAASAGADSNSPVGGDAAEQELPLSRQVCLLLLANLHTCTHADALTDAHTHTHLHLLFASSVACCWLTPSLIYPPAPQGCFHAHCWNVNKHHLCLSKALPSSTLYVNDTRRTQPVPPERNVATAQCDQAVLLAQDASDLQHTC